MIPWDPTPLNCCTARGCFRGWQPAWALEPLGALSVASSWPQPVLHYFLKTLKCEAQSRWQLASSALCLCMSGPRLNTSTQTESMLTLWTPFTPPWWFLQTPPQPSHILHKDLSVAVHYRQPRGCRWPWGFLCLLLSGPKSFTGSSQPQFGLQHSLSCISPIQHRQFTTKK